MSESPALSRLNEEGVRRFSEFIADGASGPAPRELLSDPETSEPVSPAVRPDRTDFTSRYEFGVYLNRILQPLDAAAISRDQGFWSAAALFWFDQICPASAAGVRDPDKDYRYILSRDYRHYYRHAVRSPWHLVRLHGANARLLLVSPKEQEHPLSVHGEILEQVGGRQQILGSRPIVSVASRLYFDDATGRPKTGVAGSGRGSARRFGLVLRQLDLTWDPESMPDNGLIDILPAEFDRWKAPKPKQAPAPGPAAGHAAAQAGAAL